MVNLSEKIVHTRNIGSVLYETLESCIPQQRHQEYSMGLFGGMFVLITGKIKKAHHL